MSQEEAVRIIQAAERARQGRLRAKLNKESRDMKWMYKTKDPGPAATEAAAICIQKVLKKHFYMHFLLPCVIVNANSFIWV